MKTTWSFALLAGSAIASPSWEQWSSEGSWESSTSSVASSSSATVSSAVASSTTSSSASVESSSAASTSAAVSSSVSSTESSSAVVSSTPSSSAVLTTSSSVSSSTASAVLSSSSEASHSSVASSSSASSLSSVSSTSHTVPSTWSASSWSSVVSSSSVASSSPVKSSSSALSSAVLSSSSVYSSGKVSSSSALSTAASSASTESAVLSSSSAKSSSAASGVLSSSAAHSTGTHKKHHHTAHSSGSAVTKSSPASSVSTAATSTEETTTFVTKLTTVYTTTYPVASSYVSTVSAATWGGSSSVESGIWTSLTTSTVTSVYYSTVTEAVTCPAVTETSVTTIYKTVYPSGVSPVSTAQTTSTSTLTSTLTLSPEVSVAGVSTVYVSPVPIVSSESAGKSAASTTVTQITAHYTTVYPTTTTIVSANSTLTSVKTVTSTVSGVFLSSITYNAESTAPSSSTEFPVSTVTFGSTTLTYTVTAPITFPTVVPTKHHHTWGPWVVSSQSEGSAAASGSAGVSGSVVKSGSAAASSSAAGSSSAAASSGKPSKAASSGASAVVTSARVSGTARASGTASVSVIRPTSATSSAPAATSSTCVRCEGQPGTDQFCGYTAADNWYKVTPKTCRTVYYDWTITNTTFAPDGVSRIGLLINGQFPGPLIEASWGDTIVLNLKNELTDNGTSIHFHGQRQLRNNEMDGVPSITQCPLAPGESMTYTFTAENYGSSWYHSHFSLQIQDGVQGPMLIHGPLQSGVTYDDEEFFVLTDWNHVSLNELYDTSQDVNNPHSGPPVLDTGLINGLNVWNDSGVEVGSRFKMTVTQGKSYRIRLVNTGAQSSFKFYVDQHNFTVIAADYVPIVPYVTNIVNLNCGQRYDVILKADQPVANYWARSDGQNVCMVLKNNLDIKAIIHYEGADDELPTSTAWPYVPKCEDEPMASLVPVVALNAGNQDQTVDENVLIGGNGATPNLFKWTLSGTSFTSEWDSPTLIGITNNGSVPDWSGSLDIETKGLGEWIYIIIESPIPVPHPIHLHGHDFFVLAQGYGHYDSSIPLQLTNPPRRDTAMMPSYQGNAGYLVIAYETDNPGAWLLHCHIIWHAAMGLALQIIEGLDEIKDTVKYADNNNQVCADWHAWDVATNWDITATDSGI